VSTQMVILLFTLLIYILILVIFNKARKKYAGGKVGDVINLILVTTSLLFVADYFLLLAPYLAESTIVTVQALTRTAALSFLGFGGMRLID